MATMDDDELEKKIAANIKRYVIDGEPAEVKGDGDDEVREFIRQYTIGMVDTITRTANGPRIPFRIP